MNKIVSAILTVRENAGTGRIYHFVDAKSLQFNNPTRLEIGAVTLQGCWIILSMERLDIDHSCQRRISSAVLNSISRLTRNANKLTSCLGIYLPANLRNFLRKETHFLKSCQEVSEILRREDSEDLSPTWRSQFLDIH